MALLEKQLAWIKENKVKSVLIGIVSLGLFGFAQLEFLHYSSSPPFCKGMCHSMDFEVRMWEISSHALRDMDGDGKSGDIDCVHCHFGEGAVRYLINKVVAMNDVKNTITGYAGRRMEDEEHFGSPEHVEAGYMTHEQAEDEKLMDDMVLPQYVHNMEIDLGGGITNLGFTTLDKPTKYIDEDGNYRIQLHRYGFLWNILEENCKNCHSSKGNRGKHSNRKVAEFITIDALFAFGDKANTEEEFKIDARKPLSGIKAPHAFHLDRGIPCLDCHQEIVHASQKLKDEHYARGGRMGPTGAVFPRMVICFRCHNDRRAPRDCMLCHKYQKRMNLGIDGIGVEHEDSYMYPDNADCTDCHLEENDYKMNVQICIDCHDDEEIGDILTEWQSDTESSLAELKSQLKEVEAVITEAEKQGRDVSAAQELFDDAYHNYKMVWYDGSRGGHNIDYAEALLTVSREKLKLVSGMLMMY